MQLPITDFRFWNWLRPMRGTMVCALVVLLLDVVIDGSYLFSLLICPIWFLAAVVRTLAHPPSSAVAAARVSIPLFTLLFVISNASLQNRIAETRAVRLIRACEQYHNANGSFPQRLNDLVPQYSSSIPRAKYCLKYCDFWYISSPQPILVWYEFPPFGRRVYSFQRGDTRSID